MIRILHVVGTMDMGGQETFIMNLYRKIDKKQMQFDFVVHSQKRGYYDDEIEKLGGKIFRIAPIGKHVWKHCKELYSILKNNDYNIIHRHTCSSIVAIDLLVAKIAKVKKRIVHCHATKATDHKYINVLLRPLMNYLSNVKLACSISAGKFLFGKKEKFKVIYNAIDVQKFKFDESVRNNIREKYNSKEKFVIGHVGRFGKEKNHMFLLKVFKDIVEEDKNVELWLIGDGELKEQVQKAVENDNIKSKVKFLGTQSDVSKFLMAIDVFVFPSLYEGLGIALIEAQCTGLNCVVSDEITQEAIITDNVKKLKLNIDPKYWAETILNSKSTKRYINFDTPEIQKYTVEYLINQMKEVYN